MSGSWATWLAAAIALALLLAAAVTEAQKLASRWLGVERRVPAHLAHATIAVVLHARSLPGAARTLAALLAHADAPQRVTVHVAEAHGVPDASVLAAASELVARTPPLARAAGPLRTQVVARSVIMPGSAGAPGDAVVPGLHAVMRASVPLTGPDAPAFVLTLGGPMAVAPGWDNRLLADWAAARDDAAILTTIPAPMARADWDTVRAGVLTRLATRVLADSPHMRVPVWTAVLPAPHGKPLPPGTVLPRPLASVGWTAAFSFAPTAAWRCVPLAADLPLTDDCANTLHAVRLWTRGWNFYAPRDALFATHELPGTPLTTAAARSALRALRAMRFVTKLPNSSDGATPRELTAFPRLQARYGYGVARDAAAFWVWTGFCVRTGGVTQNGAIGRPRVTERPSRRDQTVQQDADGAASPGSPPGHASEAGLASHGKA